MEPTSSILESETPREMAQRINLSFTNYLLLSRALTHRSYLNEHTEALEDNERLEFLGDAVLDFIVGAWLYNRFPEMAEGPMTRLRSALVRTEKLAQFALDLELNKAMRLGRGESDSGGRSRPALLCATFEALIGALYLDSDIRNVCDFVEPMLDREAYQLISSGRTQDPKSRLQEWTQAQGYGAPHYRTVSAIGPDHSKVFEVEVIIDNRVGGLGSGHSKQAAAKAAAREAMEKNGISYIV